MHSENDQEHHEEDVARFMETIAPEGTPLAQERLDQIMQTATTAFLSDDKSIPHDQTRRRIPYRAVLALGVVAASIGLILFNLQWHGRRRHHAGYVAGPRVSSRHAPTPRHP